MYDVTIYNDGLPIIIHDHRSASNSQRLQTASIVEAVNSIAAFEFEITPLNGGYNDLHEFTTMVRVQNTKRNRFEFVGRVLQINPSMDSDGTIRKSVICEDRLGYLHDSVQPYAAMRHYEGDGTRTGLEEFIDLLLANHNSQVEEHKRIYRGMVTVDPFKSSESVSKGLNWETTYNCISDKLIKSFGGYVVLREGNDGLLYLDYLESVGTTRKTTIEVGRNMSAASREIDTTGIVTRLVPLGAKREDSEERLTIASVNGGVNYIESADYLARYGIRYATIEFDDVTTAGNLYRKGVEWLAVNNGLAISHAINALDLSTIGLDIDDFVLYDRYPVKNMYIGMDDTLQIIKKQTNVIEPQNSSFDMGDIVKRLSDMMASDNSTLKDVQQVVSQVNSKVEQQYTTIYTYIDSSMANLQIDTDKIVSEVLQQSVAKSEYETFASTVRNILQMEADGTTIIFQTILEEIARVEGVESTHYAELLTHIRFSADGVEIGRTGSAITMRLDNERLGFYNNGTLVAYISDNQLYITDGHFLNSLRIGKYAFVPEDNGSTSFVYMEE